MKKSKFLKSSKDLLSRSFNPSKCKISLRLAGSRLKLLKNKKEMQVKQMKREIAQLLESGQNPTARIRVVHVISEEKMLAAYDLIEIYCELLVSRLPIIESQKTCPIDLKEAIASVVYASPRFGDVPELLDVRKQLTEKYGKDFTTAAIELRPECGVSRMLVEKLSAVAPDGQTKIKSLTAIAKEHNVKWDPESFGEKESVAPSDLLTGPSTFVNDGKLPVEPTRFERSDIRVHQSDNKMHGSPLNFTQMDRRASLGTEFRYEERPPGNERAQLFHGGNVPLDRRRWTMDFKDATSAAQAAAESAELASMAARAAAELSSRGRITRQYSTESHKSDVHVLDDGGPETYVDSKLAGDQYEELNRSFSKHTRLHSGQINETRRTKEYSQSASLRSKATVGDDSFNQEISRGEMNMQRQSFKYRAESADSRPEGSENAREERIWKQPSGNSSPFHSSTFNDGNRFSNFGNQKVVYDAVEDPFLGFGKEGTSEASKTGFGESASVVFDKSDSDSDSHGFDMGSTYDSWSPKSRASKIVNTTSSPFLTRKNSSDFPGNMRPMYGLKLDESKPVIFDDSDGGPSESEEDVNISERNRRKTDPPAKFNPSKTLANQATLEPENEGLNFGKLTGGFRHKGYYSSPSYLKDQFIAPSANKESEETTASPTVESPSISRMFQHNKKSTTKPDLQSELDSDSSEEEEYSWKSTDHKRELNTLSAGKAVKPKPSLTASNSIFDSDNSDFDADLPKQSSTTTSHLRSGVSRRTKVYPSSSSKNVYSHVQHRSDDFGEGPGRKPTTSNISETPKKSNSRINSSKIENYQQPASAEVASEPSKHSKSSAIEELTRPQPKKEVSLSKENPKAAALSKTSSNKDDSNQKVSHVHPKLPDYDTLVQAFRRNRT